MIWSKLHFRPPYIAHSYYYTYLASSFLDEVHLTALVATGYNGITGWVHEVAGLQGETSQEGFVAGIEQGTLEFRLVLNIFLLRI